MVYYTHTLCVHNIKLNPKHIHNLNFVYVGRVSVCGVYTIRKFNWLSKTVWNVWLNRTEIVPLEKVTKTLQFVKCCWNRLVKSLKPLHFYILYTFSQPSENLFPFQDTLLIKYVQSFYTEFLETFQYLRQFIFPRMMNCFLFSISLCLINIYGIVVYVYVQLFSFVFRQNTSTPIFMSVWQ